MKHVVDVFWPPLPANLSPTDWVRRWDQAALIGAVVFAICVLACALIWSRPLDMSVALTLRGILTWDAYFQARAEGGRLHHVAAITTWLMAGVAAAMVAKAALKPHQYLRHISGPRLWDDAEEAAIQAQIQSRALMVDQAPWMHLHPSFPIPKSHAARGTMIVGGPGGGKTQILSGLMAQHFDRDRRAVIYDVKGDWTEWFYAHHRGHCRILNPWDARSVRWDIARDLTTKQEAAAFANGFFPPGDGDGRIWNDGAALILTAIICQIIAEHGQDWGCDTLSAWVSLSHADLVARLQEHPLAVKALGKEDSNSASSMAMTLGIGIKLIADLATAWDRTQHGESFSWREWLTSPRTKQRQIIVQGTGMDQSTRSALMGGIFNYLACAVTNAQLLPDDLHGRSLIFCIDEFATVNRFDIPTLIHTGRSKGCVIYLATQDIAQVEMIYGKPMRQSIESSMATKIICQLGMGETRREVAEAFNYRLIASTLPQYTFGASTSQTISVTPESRAVVDASDLGNKIGVVRGKRFHEGFGIRAILTCEGDPLILEWEGVKRPKTSAASVPAAWTIIARKPSEFEQPTAQHEDVPTALEVWKASLGEPRA
ncbi:type IV secretion system DNA-binding domain-containing protein [Pseudoxanthomonas mexicana]